MSSKQKRLQNLRDENAKLRKAIAHLSDRQQAIEEFLDLEFPSDHLKLFEGNRDRMMFALGYNVVDDVREQLLEGKRHPKSTELVRLLRVVKRYQRPPGEKKRKSKKDACNPVELQPFRIFINRNTGKIERKPPKRCERCYAPGHIRANCPYKYENSRTEEVKDMIKRRIEEIKKIEIDDPFLSKKYKKRHFKADPVKKAFIAKRSKQREELYTLKNMLESNNQTVTGVIEHLKATKTS